MGLVFARTVMATIVSIVFIGLPNTTFAETSTVFVVKAYSYDYTTSPDAPEIARSLCGARCNSISGTLNSYMMPGGWRLVRSPQEKKIILDIETPFIAGKCICSGDEYVVTKDTPLPDSPK